MNEKESEEIIEIPSTLSIALPITPEMAKQIRPTGAATLAEIYQIDSAIMAQAASNQRTEWAKRIDGIKEARKDFMEPLKTFMTNYDKKWFSPPMDDYEQGRTLLGEKLLAWDRKEKARVDSETAEREAIARKWRLAAEIKVAAERAKAEEKARELRRQAEVAEAARQKALSEGNARAAASAAAESAKALERAAAALEEGNAKAITMQIAATLVDTAPIPIVEKIEGSSTRDNWLPELKPGLTEEQAKELIVKGAATDPQLLGLLKLDMPAINKLAKALRSVANIPGFVVVNRPTLAGARK